MIVWAAFTHNDIKYDLSHLHPTKNLYIQAGKDGKPEQKYWVEVCYSLHCFSQKREPIPDTSLNYSDAKETRTFDFTRYELSKQLPNIIQNLHQKKCMHTGKGNFFLIEVIMPNGEKADYEVYFDIQRANGKARLFVQSAYVRDIAHGNKTKTTKKISLFVILHNRLTGKPINIQL